MPKFRKKPVVIEARQFSIEPHDTTSKMEELSDWCGGQLKGYFSNPITREIHINTLEGVMIACVNDWIIKGVKGEFYPCKPDIFAATYDPV